MINKSKLKAVTSPKLYVNDDYQEIDEDGLLSERIFGPLRNYKCRCGQYTSEILHKGKTCNICKVKCDSNILRYKTFGKIILPYPVYKPTIDVRKILLQIIGKKKYLIDPVQSDLASSIDNYLSFNKKLSIVDTFDNYCIPIHITGIYTFYLALLAMQQTIQIKNLDTLIKAFNHEILVLPPKCRIVVLNRNNNQLIKHQIVDHYVQILQLCQYDCNNDNDDDKWLALIDSASTPIVDNELINCDLAIAKYQYYINNIYKETLKIVSGKKGLIRNTFLGKSVDFSSRAHIISNPKLQAYQITLPEKIFIRLFFLEYLRYLYKFKNVSFENLNLYVNQTEIKLSNELDKNYYQDFIKWFFEDGNVTEVDKLVIINRQPSLFNRRFYW